MIEAVPTATDADAELAAIEAGAQDLEPGDDNVTLFLTEPTDLDAVCKALPNFGFKVESAKLGYRPKNPVKLGAAELEEVEAFLDAIDGDDDVQTVYAGLASE
jgi:transcriptional/translational regulatory protein YebC/TACO1